MHRTQPDSPAAAPFFPVVVPCRGVADSPDECLQSLLSQSFRDRECLLFDEESRDGTLSVARKACFDRQDAPLAEIARP